MQPHELYQSFNNKWYSVALPYIEDRFSRDAYSEPIYYYIDGFQMRRFRSGMCLLLAEQFGVRQDLALPIGAASELVFYGALVHDDIFDHDKRRGEIHAAHLRFGREIASASANYAYSIAFGMVHELSDMDLSPELFKEILNGFNNAQQRLFHSFLHEMLHTFDPSVDLNAIEQLHLDKTVQGVNALKCIGMLVDEAADGPTVSALRNYAELIARAGQIKNDVYDIERYPTMRGYSDLRNGYVNYLVCELLNQQDMCASEVVKLLKNGEFTVVVGKLYEYGIIDRAHSLISELVDKAMEKIARLDLPPMAEEILVAWAEGNRQKSKLAVSG